MSRAVHPGWAALIAALLATGCAASSAVDADCAALLTTTRVQYVGHAFGKGEVTLQAAAGEQVRGQMVLRGESPEEPTLTLSAAGTCRHGIARLRIAGLDAPDAPLRVLGGRLVVVRDGELMGGALGMWRAEVMKKGAEEPRQLHGYLRSLEAGVGEVSLR